MQDTPTWKVGQSLQSFIAENYLQWHTAKKALPYTSVLRRQENGRKPNARPVRMKPEYRQAQQQQPARRQRIISKEAQALGHKILTHLSGQDGGTGRLFGRRQVEDYCSRHDLRPHLAFSENLRTQDQKARTNFAFLHWLFSEEDPEAASAFLTELANSRMVSLVKHMDLDTIVQRWDSWHQSARA